MYLSKLILNPMDRMVWRDRGDCCQMHRTIMRAFPEKQGGESPRAAYDVLYRLEIHEKKGVVILYVQSAIEPDWSHLISTGYLKKCDRMDNPAVKEIARPLGEITEGMILRFRLLANPTKKIVTATKEEREVGIKKNGKRVALLRMEEQVDWLRRKAKISGFQLLDVSTGNGVPDVTTSGIITEAGYKQADKEKNKEKYDRLFFRGVVFDGRLCVKDKDRFLHTVRKGIGSGKAYGFGLLSLAPA